MGGLNVSLAIRVGRRSQIVPEMGWCTRVFVLSAIQMHSRGKRMKNQAKILRSERFFSLFKFSIFSPFFSISIPISISKFPKSSISISKSIFRKCKFQYQYQNQYFETVVFNIKININMSKILTFQNFSKFCAMSDELPLLISP